jgi:signal transduction histidine kinase
LSEEDEIKKLSALLDERTMRLMERESELADNFEEIEAQKEELTAAIEQLVIKNQNLIERNQELDQILYRSSHDLKSPLSSMVGLLSLLKSEPLPEHIKVYCTHFDKRLQQMDSVINTLILLGQSVLDEIKVAEVKLSDVVEEEIAGLHFLENFQLIDFKIKLSGLNVVVTDNLLIRILIRCLVSNALIFRESKRGVIEVRIESSEKNLQLMVMDDGEGIANEIESKMWDMFYRGSEKSVGQGMGLYLVKKIVGRLNGTIIYYRKDSVTIFEASVPIFPAPIV